MLNSLWLQRILWQMGLLLALGTAAGAGEKPLERVVVAKDGVSFALESSGKPFIVWGFNYDHDDGGRLLEDYWAAEWATVEQDFREMKAMDANVVRVHLQLPRFMKTATDPDAENLKRLQALVRLAERTGLYLDLTGLACYHKQDVPAWYDKLDESRRWEVQERFWKAVASACGGSPAIFCYDLMNEPVVGGGKNAQDWLAGEPFGGNYFVQRIAIDLKGRTQQEIARQWVARLAGAIRSVDRRTLITVGVIPWAQVFKGAKPLFYAPEVRGPLDFVSVHFYPKEGQLDASIEALKVYEIGKPLVIEEIFPLGAGLEEMKKFIDRSRAFADGWVSFYWGKTTAELERSKSLKDALVASWLKAFQALAPAAQGRPR